MTTFSLLVPSYNRPDFIRESILSLLGNSAPDVEIIVSDDASPKRVEIRQALEDFVAAGKLKYLQQEKNLGWSNNRNALIEAAQGEYVILLGDDDRLKPGSINRLREWTKEFPEVSLFGMGYDVIDEKGNRVFTYCTPRHVTYQIAHGAWWREIFYYDAVPMWSHHPFTMCCRRSLALQNPYCPEVDVGDDTLFLFEILSQGETFMALADNCFEWRNTFDQTGDYSNLSSQSGRSVKARRLIWKKLMQHCDLPTQVNALIRDRTFLQRFLSISRQDAVALSARCSSDVKLLAEWTVIIDGSLLVELPYEKVWRHLRAVRVMGLGHLKRLAQYFIDKAQLRARLQASAKN